MKTNHTIHGRCSRFVCRPIALLLGWVRKTETLLMISGIQLVCFFIIWLFMYFGYKKQVKELNELQEKNRNHSDRRH